MRHLGQKLLLGQARPRLRAWLGCKKGIHQVLFVEVKFRDSHVDHVVVDDADLVELAIVLRQHVLPEVQFLLFHLNIGLDID